MLFTWFQYLNVFGANGTGVPDFGFCPFNVLLFFYVVVVVVVVLTLTLRRRRPWPHSSSTVLFL